MRSILWGEHTALLDQTQYTQPALFVLEYALARLWQSWGIQPTAVMGHSVGEYVAACIAEVFSLADALKLITSRARLMQALPEGGGMLAVQCDEDTLTQYLAEYNELVIAGLQRCAKSRGLGCIGAVRKIKPTTRTRGHQGKTVSGFTCLPFLIDATDVGSLY